MARWRRAEAKFEDTTCSYLYHLLCFRIYSTFVAQLTGNYARFTRVDMKVLRARLRTRVALRAVGSEVGRVPDYRLMHEEGASQAVPCEHVQGKGTLALLATSS